MTPRALHIFNPGERFRADVKKIPPPSSPDAAVWVQREHPYHVETIVRWGLQEGFRSFIVWGGDGSFHRVVQSFQDLNLWADAVAGLVPVGTCNDLARHWGLTPGDIPGALAIIRDANTKRMDVGLASWQGPQGPEAQIFTNNAGFGRSCEAIRGQWGAVRSIYSFRARHLHIEADGKTQEDQFLMGIVCNGPFFNKGLRFSKETSCFDGRLDGFFIKETNRLVLLSRLARGRRGKPLAGTGVSRLHGRIITIRSEDPLCLQADGETLAENGVKTIEFSMMPDKLKIYQ